MYLYTIPEIFMEKTMKPIKSLLQSKLNIIILIIIASISLITVYFNIKQHVFSLKILFLEMASIASILFLLYAMTWKTNNKMNLLLFIFSVTFSIYTLELALFLFFPFADNATLAISNIANIAKNQGIKDFDARTKIQVVQDIRKKGINAYPSIHPDMLFDPEKIMWDCQDIFPLAGISNTHTVFCNESGKYITYQSDEHGFNNKQGLYKSSTKIDIALIGDSFTQGSCIMPEHNFSGNLMKHSFNVLNFGNGGSGPLFEYAIFKEYVTVIKPKVVLWFYYQNDMDDLLKEQRVPILAKYYTEDQFSQKLLSKQNTIDSALKTYIDKKISQYKGSTGINAESIFKLWELRSRMGLLCKQDSFEKKTSHELEKIFSNIMSKTQQAISTWDGHFVFIYLPGHYAFSSNNKNHHNMIMNIINRLGIGYIDIFDFLSDHPDPLSLFPFRLPLHYNEEGYRLISDEIVRYLKTHFFSNKRDNPD